MPNAVLLLSCKDRKGIVAKVSNFIFENNGNIVTADQHLEKETNTFFMRVEWDLKDFKIPKENIEKEFNKIANEFQMKFRIEFTDYIQNVAIFVSKYQHCLVDLLTRYRIGELKCNIPLIISNHPDLKEIADFYGIDYYIFPKNPQNKVEVEKKEIKLLKKYKIDLIVLARYMQILTGNFVKKYKNKIINVHHSFLPSFAGANPYRQAYERGVKIIGATAHYVTEELDQGPIIEQEVIRISHKDSLADLKRKGQDLEKIVLARAVKWHLEHKILVYKNKTVVFE